MLKRVLLLSAIIFSGCTLLPEPSLPIKREPVIPADGSTPIGPYSPGIKVGNMLFCSGQLAINPATGDLIIGDIKDETRQALKNLGAVLKAAGMDYKDVTKTTVYLLDMNDFKLYNEAYAEFFPENSQPPARETVQVARLPRDGRIEISCIAVKAEE
jgi:2-iminobutanoate/2-iminopropanoate deaminase